MDSSSHHASAHPERTPQQDSAEHCQPDWRVLALSGIPLLLFVLLSLFNLDQISQLITAAFTWSANTFGAYWQLLLLATFFISLGIGFSKNGRARIGHTTEVDMSTFRWVAVIMCTLLAGGGVFWSAAEPLAHFIEPGPIFDSQANTYPAAIDALAQSFMHWGFLAWAILASLTGIVLSHLHYDRGLPLQPRTLLYPVLGTRIMHGWPGAIVDAVCVLAVAAGTIGPIGFLGLQISSGLHTLLDWPNVFVVQAGIIAVLVAIYITSATTGITRGIQFLSHLNVVLALGLMGFIVIFGPTLFLANAFVEGVGDYIQHFIPMATSRADKSWLSEWTIFFWGWFLGYSPLMAILVARISRGRSIRQMIIVISLLAPIATMLWYTILGGTGLAYELDDPGLVIDHYSSSDMSSALLAITQQLPLGLIMSILFLILTTLFVATTGDSMTYAIAMVMTADEHPKTSVRIFWGIAMGATALILITLGDGGVSALQSFIVITAVPVSFILLPTLWTAPQAAARMGREQQVAARPHQVDYSVS